MKKIFLLFFILCGALFADLSKMINIPNNSMISSLTFRYISTDGDIQTQKLESNFLLTSNSLFLSQHEEGNFLSKIDTEHISRINSLVVEYKDESNNKFFKPIYYNLAILTQGKPLYVLKGDSSMSNNMNRNSENYSLMPHQDNNMMIDGFTLNKKNNNSYQKIQDNSIEKKKVMEFKKYNLNYIKNAMNPVILDGIDVSKKEKHFCTIPIRDNIFYFVDKKALFVIFKDFELTSDMYVENNKITIKFEQENKFRPCVLNNINQNISKMTAFHKQINGGEIWFNAQFSSDIKSASIVYPKEKSDIMSYNEELKDIIVYKIEY